MTSLIPSACPWPAPLKLIDERQPLEETLEINATAQHGQIFSLQGTVK
jgi:hypothetical protein